MSPPWEKPFVDALDLVLRLEGGETNDPRDPGGRTKYGLSQRSYPHIDFDALTEDIASSVYRRDYWVPLRCGDMPPAIGLAVFDCAVNQGPGFAARAVQRAAGVPEDGAVGPRTLAAILAAPDKVLVELMARRAVRYADNSRFEVFGLGWMRRLMTVYREAVKMEG